MNRRSYIKSILLLGVAGITSYSGFKWWSLGEKVTPGQLLSKREIIAELAEVIIPGTETPGAKEANVQDYIINVMINCRPVKQQRRFLNGIEDLEEFAVNHYGKHFLKCNSAEKHAVVEYFSIHSGYTNKFINKVHDKILGGSFFYIFRDLTIEGYCQSKLGATRGLAYDYIPATFEACIPILSNQRSWATK